MELSHWTDYTVHWSHSAHIIFCILPPDHGVKILQVLQLYAAIISPGPVSSLTAWREGLGDAASKLQSPKPEQKPHSVLPGETTEFAYSYVRVCLRSEVEAYV